MTDREKLIELCENLILSCKSSLCNDCEHNKIDYPHCMSVHFADYLLANGVIVPPCKVGDRVYLVGVFTGQIIETKVIGIAYNESGIYLILENFTVTSVAEQLGKTVFLTKEEAEEKLKELGK